MVVIVDAVRFDGDRLVGDMFDGVGLVHAVKDAGMDLKDRRVLLLGAGGAARGATCAHPGARGCMC